MPNIEELMDTVGQTISEKKQGDVYFTTLDLTYAYGQLPLNAETSIVQFFSNWRPFDGYIPVQNRILWPHYNARGIPTRNGLYTRRIPASACVHR